MLVSVNTMSGQSIVTPIFLTMHPEFGDVSSIITVSDWILTALAWNLKTKRSVLHYPAEDFRVISFL
jgi:hypothetical protein